MLKMSTQFGIREGTVYNIMVQVTITLLKLWDKYIYWLVSEYYKQRKVEVALLVH